MYSKSHVCRLACGSLRCSSGETSEDITKTGDQAFLFCAVVSSQWRAPGSPVATSQTHHTYCECVAVFYRCAFNSDQIFRFYFESSIQHGCICRQSASLRECSRSIYNLRISCDCTQSFIGGIIEILHDNLRISARTSRRAYFIQFSNTLNALSE